MKPFLIALLLIPSLSLSQTIPSANITKWKVAGHQGFYPKNIQHLNIMNYGGNASGTVNNNPALSSAIAALNNHAGVIEFPAGTFLFNSTIYLPDSIIIRGAGSNATVFNFNFNNAVGDCFVMSGGPVGNYVTAVSGYTKGSKYVKIGRAHV